MTPKQLRDSANGPWEACPKCGRHLVTRAKQYSTADSDINVFVCNRFSDGYVLCSSFCKDARLDRDP